MREMRGATLARIASSELFLLVVAGLGLALLGWQAADRFRARSLARLVFAGTPDRTEPHWTVAFLFTPRECAGRMALAERLGQISDPRVSVRGVLLVDQDRFPGWRDLVAANRIRFPVHAVSPQTGYRALHRLGELATPTLAVFDPQRRLRLITDLAGAESLDALVRDIRSVRPTTAKEGPP